MRSQFRYQPGDKIGGRYHVHRALMGGMGEVYLCLDLKTIQPFALKTFQQRFLTDPRIRKAFENEIATWISLEKHPNIVRCLHLETLDNQPFMILEWIASDESRSTDLRGWLRGRSLDLQSALNFVIDICRGLIHAQQKQLGIVHRDLKPENILIAQGQLAKITDWGLAKAVETAKLDVAMPESTASGRQSLWGRGGLVGTPSYMAPEQWRGETLDVRTDIYAIGCILYETLTGRRPFQSNTFDGLRCQHLEADIPRILDTTWSKPLNTLLSCCLAKQREQRFGTVSELLQQLILIYKHQFGAAPREAIILGGSEFTATDYNNRGCTFHSLGRHNEALTDFDRAIHLDPLVANAYSNRGNVYRSLRQYNKALADFDGAIQLDPTFPLPYVGRGAVYQELRRYDQAMSDYNHALQLDPNFTQVYTQRGFTYESMLRFDEALADHNKAIQLNQDLVEAYVNRCATFGMMNRLTEALADAEHAIHLNPMLPKAYMNRALTYMRLNRFNEALSDFARAIELDPNDAENYYNRAKLFEIFRKFDKAISDYSRAIQNNPNYSWAYNSRGYVYSILNHFDRALDDFTRAIEIDPNHVLAYTNRGTLYFQLDQCEKAISDFTKAIQIDPTNIAAYTNRGAAYYQTNRYDEATADFKKGTELDPSNAIAYRNLGILADKCGLPQEALRYYESAAELGDAEAQAQIAQAKRKGRITSVRESNVERMIRRLKTDREFSRLFRSDPVRAVMEFDLTISEVIELVASEALSPSTMQDWQARLKLLEFIASLGKKK